MDRKCRLNTSYTKRGGGRCDLVVIDLDMLMCGAIESGAFLGSDFRLEAEMGVEGSFFGDPSRARKRGSGGDGRDRRQDGCAWLR